MAARCRGHSASRGETTESQLSLITFDLGGITDHSGVSQFPDYACGEPRAGEPWLLRSDRVGQLFDLGAAALPNGVRALSSARRRRRPGPTKAVGESRRRASAGLRRASSRSFQPLDLVSRASDPAFPAWTSRWPILGGFTFGRMRLSNGGQFPNAAGRTPLGWPIFWISVGLAALVACWFAQ